MLESKMGVRSFVKDGFASLFREQEHGFCDGLRALSLIWVCSLHGIDEIAFGWKEEISDAGYISYHHSFVTGLPLAGELSTSYFVTQSRSVPLGTSYIYGLRFSVVRIYTDYRVP